jgi:peptide methionine sulfoxide reductase MsrB
MTSPHAEIDQGGGHKFGCMRITVDPEGEDCVIVCDIDGHRLKRTRLSSLDEIEGTHMGHVHQIGPKDALGVHKHTAAALRFAATMIQNHRAKR